MEKHDEKQAELVEQDAQEISADKLEEANGGGFGALVTIAKGAYKVGYWVGTKIN